MKLKILVAILCSLIAAAALCWSYPAAAVDLINIPVTTAVTAQVSPTFQLRAGPGAGVVPSSMAVQGTVTGTAGTSITWWLQASFDGGTTWCDALAFSHVAAGRAAGVVLSNPTAGVAPAACTDGTATPPFVQNGIYAGLWRVKYSSVGTWTTGNLRIDAFGNGIVPFP
jgi:hypothetical protein